MGQVDVLIVGGGPAGCAAGTMLARQGREVVVVDPCDAPRDRWFETLPPQSNRLLRILGIAEQMVHEEYQRSTGAVSAWGSDKTYVNDFLFDPQGDGWHLD